LVGWTACWGNEPRDRPPFADILARLSDISNSPFIATSTASFRSLQQTWRVEIESCFAELRARDDVRTPRGDRDRYHGLHGIHHHAHALRG